MEPSSRDSSAKLLLAHDIQYPNLAGVDPATQAKLQALLEAAGTPASAPDSGSGGERAATPATRHAAPRSPSPTLSCQAVGRPVFAR